MIVRVETSSGLVGWGESFGGAAARTVSNAIDAMAPFVLGRSPWEAEAIRAELYWQGLGSSVRPILGNAAWAGIDTALWDICGKSCKELVPGSTSVASSPTRSPPRTLTAPTSVMVSALGGAAGGLEIQHDERDVPQGGAQLVEGQLGSGCGRGSGHGRGR